MSHAPLRLFQRTSFKNKPWTYLIRRYSTTRGFYISTEATASMKALYLRPRNKDPAVGPVNDSTDLPTPADLKLSDDFPRPKFNEQAGEGSRGRSYLLKVLTVSPTRGELAWPEQLETPPSKRTDFGPVPCHDVVGEVIAVNGGASSVSGSVEQQPNHDQVQVGDKVFGLVSWDLDGAAAKEAVALEGEVTKIPQRPEGQGFGTDASWEEMLTTIPLSGFTAWQALFEHGGLTEPRASDAEFAQAAQGEASETKKILVSGASGSVGLLVLQLLQAAKSHAQPLHVTTISSPRSVEAVKSLGPDIVANGEQTEEAVQTHGPFNLFVEMTGGSLRDSILSMHKPSQDATGVTGPLMKPTGRIVSITSPLTESELLSNVKDLEDRFTYFIFTPNAEQLVKIGRLVQTGRLRGFVHDEIFPLERGKEALEECEKRGRKGLGKVVIRVSS